MVSYDSREPVFMTVTLSDILSRTDDIKLAAKKLGFEEDVRLGDIGGNVLYLILKFDTATPSKEYTSRKSDIRIWLTYLLGCRTHIYTPESTKNTIHETSVKEAVSLDDPSLIRQQLGDEDIESIILLDDKLDSLDLRHEIPRLEIKILGKTSSSTNSILIQSASLKPNNGNTNSIINMLPTLTAPQLDQVRLAIDKLTDEQKELKEHSPPKDYQSPRSYPKR
jgi:hypothetical protein